MPMHSANTWMQNSFSVALPFLPGRSKIPGCGVALGATWQILTSPDDMQPHKSCILRPF